jgi:ubiquinone/menaquinone biosynthesis C-methylase UbiE
MKTADGGYEYQKGSNRSLPSRDLATYEWALGFSKKELEGLKILDLGAHKDQRFARQLGGDVVSISPDFSDERGREKEIDKIQYPAVAGLGQQLPFADNTFDREFDYGGPGIFIDDLKEKVLFLREVIRTLKEGGQYVTLLVDQENILEFETVEKILKLEFDNLNIKFEDINYRSMPFGKRFILKKQKCT